MDPEEAEHHFNHATEDAIVYFGNVLQSFM